MQRREFLTRALTAPVVARTGIAASSAAEAQTDVAGLLKVNDLDRSIWQEELEAFVPARLYDMHGHLTRREFDLDPRPERYVLTSSAFRKEGTLELLDAANSLLCPGRDVTHLLAPNPHPKCDFKGSNDFIAREALKKPGTGAQMVVHPSMSAQDIDREVRRHRFVGFKPYRWYSVTGDIDECRITDFMPEHQLEVANRYGLVIRMHLSKKAAIADRENLDDLERLTAKYPRVRWLLAHCARSYTAWPLERAASRLKNIPNLWYESSSVCETDAFDALFSLVDRKLVCYGTDDFAVGVSRGKYVSYGSSWGEMNESNQTLNKAHCDGRMTFVRYEMLRAMRRAARHAGFSRSDIENLFYHNGANLVEAARRDVNASAGKG